MAINNGVIRSVRADLQFRGNKFQGHLSGNEGLLKIAGKDGSATLVLDPILHVPIRVGTFRSGRASINGKSPKRGAARWAYCEPARSYRSEGDPHRSSGLMLARKLNIPTRQVGPTHPKAVTHPRDKVRSIGTKAPCSRRWACRTQPNCR